MANLLKDLKFLSTISAETLNVALNAVKLDDERKQIVASVLEEVVQMCQPAASASEAVTKPVTKKRKLTKPSDDIVFTSLVSIRCVWSLLLFAMANPQLVMTDGCFMY